MRELRKIRTCYSRIEMKDGVLRKQSFQPSLINFIYGRNGTGKTSISRALRGNTVTTEWQPGIPEDGIKVEVYNEDYIQENVRSYGNIPGVFTLTKQNAEKKELAAKKADEKAAVDSKYSTIAAEARRLTASQKKVEGLYEDTLWDDAKAFWKTDFVLAAKELPNSKNRVKEYLEKTQAVDHGLSDLQSLYEMAYDAARTGKTAYPTYTILDINSIPQSVLPGKQIVGLTDSPFSDFVKKLGALDWITTGHSRFHEQTDGRCPYCQQTLPPDFEERLAACYDQEYKKDMDGLRSFVSLYEDRVTGLFISINENLNNAYETPLKSEYRGICDVFREKINQNKSLLKQKLDNPGTPVVLEQLSTYIANLNSIALKINDEIARYNAALNNPETMKDFVKQAWEYLAFKHHEMIIERKTRRDSENEAIQKLKDEQDSLEGKSKELQNEIRVLNESFVNTTVAMEKINDHLKSCGFQGFYLREKPGAQYIYELVRKNPVTQEETIAENLSEGERNFIAFLYFYHVVTGTQSGDGVVQPKIVVIDDPVSSMDSDTLFVVAALTRELIHICYNNYELSVDGNREDYIKQIFCLTHNPFFFRELTYNYVSDYECASFFELRKKENNVSTIKECTDTSTEVGGCLINKSPVKNAYDALWDEFRHTEDPNTLMIVIRQILEYYFIQITGHTGGNLRYDLLDANKDRFETENPDGTIDHTDYRLASAMIALLNTGVTGFNDGLFFDSSSVNVSRMKKVFHMIFTVMNQEQHYDMMMHR